MRAVVLFVLIACISCVYFMVADTLAHQGEAQNRAEHLCAGHGSTLETFHADHNKRIAAVCTGGVVVIENAP